MRPLLVFAISALAAAGEYTTYIGDIYPRSVAAITTDSAGNTYVVGNRGNVSVPTAVLLLGSFSSFVGLPASPYAYSPQDVFVSKIDPTGKILFTNAFAGKGVDQGLAVAVDPTGNIYIAGTTSSVDFPISNALQPQTGQYGSGFLVKLSLDGKTILYSTYFGGLSGNTTIKAMTTDASGNLYLTGSTYAGDFPHTAGMPTAVVSQTGLPPTSAAFVTAISAAGDKILFSGTVGGTQTICSGGPHDCQGIATTTSGVAISLDAAKNVYFGGNTITVDLPTTPGAFLKQGTGAFAGKITANGAALAYLTYLGSTSELATGPVQSGANTLFSLTADNSGNAYLAGSTGDAKFPATAGAYQTSFAGSPINTFNVPSNTDGFVAKLKPDGSGLVWATYLGGNGNDVVNSLAVDAAGDVWASGTTTSTNFPNTQGWSQGGDFLVEFNPQGSALSSSARYPNGSVSQAIALDPTTLIHTAGPTGILSEIASTAPPSMKIFGVQNVAGGYLAGRVSPAEVISIYGPHIGPSTPVTAAPIAGFYPNTLGGVQVTIGGTPAPLLYVSDGQINAVVPMGLTSAAASTIQITNGTANSPSYPLWVDVSDSTIFPGVLNQNGSLNSQANPAKIGTTISFYATGWQTDFEPLRDGQVATAANNMCVTCSSSQGSITYGGAAPGIVAGISQFNLALTPSTTSSLGLQQILISNLNAFISVWITP